MKLSLIVLSLFVSTLSLAQVPRNPNSNNYMGCGTWGSTSMESARPKPGQIYSLDFETFTASGKYTGEAEVDVGIRASAHEECGKKFDEVIAAVRLKTGAGENLHYRIRMGKHNVWNCRNEWQTSTPVCVMDLVYDGQIKISSVEGRVFKGRDAKRRCQLEGEDRIKHDNTVIKTECVDRTLLRDKYQLELLKISI